MKENPDKKPCGKVILFLGIGKESQKARRLIDRFRIPCQTICTLKEDSDETPSLLFGFENHRGFDEIKKFAEQLKK